MLSAQAPLSSSPGGSLFLAFRPRRPRRSNDRRGEQLGDGASPRGSHRQRRSRLDEAGAPRRRGARRFRNLATSFVPSTILKTLVATSDVGRRTSDLGPPPLRQPRGAQLDSAGRVNLSKAREVKLPLLRRTVLKLLCARRRPSARPKDGRGCVCTFGRLHYHSPLELP